MSVPSAVKPDPAPPAAPKPPRRRVSSYLRSLSQRRRRFYIALTVVGGISLLGFALNFGWTHVQSYRFSRWARFGEEALARADVRGATLWATRLNEIDPRSLSTAKLLAVYTEASGSPDAVFWRARTAQLEPGDSAALFAWARTAVRHGQFTVADRALSVVPEKERDVLAYHSLAAAVALGSGRPGAAEPHFEACVRLDPVIPAHAIDLAGLRLRIGDPVRAEDARRTLEAFASQGGETRILALRALAAGLLLQERDSPGALAAARELAAQSSATSDRMILLEALQRAGSPDLVTVLAERKAAGERDANLIAPLAEWMNAHNLATETIAWLGGPGVGLAAPLPAQIACADAFVKTHDWSGLRSYLAARNWRIYEFLRLVLLARVAREQGASAESFRDLWRALLDDLKLSPQDSYLLAAVTQSWGWTEETEGLWLLAARGSNTASRGLSLARLFQLYQSRGQTEKILTTVQGQLELDPTNVALRNNFSFLSLLRGVNVVAAQRTASELYQKHPLNPTIASTQALSLLQQERAKEALAIFGRLTPAALNEPGVALYHALAAEAAGESARATTALETAKSGNFLPEEKKLLQACEKDLKRVL